MNGVGSIQQNLYYSNYYPQDNKPRIAHQQVDTGIQPEVTQLATSAALLQALSLSLKKVSEWCGNKLMQGKEFTTADNVKKVAQEMVRKNNLDVSVDFITPQNMKNYPAGLQGHLEAVAKGENAFYMDKLKLAVAPEKRPSLILHELGHAINATKGKFLKALQNSRVYAASVPTALLVLNDALRNKDGSPNFIERNAGILGFCAFLPTIIEEGLASFRGVKAAKQVLGNSANLKPLKRNYFFAWLTYLLSGIGLGVATKQSILLNKQPQQQ